MSYIHYHIGSRLIHNDVVETSHLDTASAGKHNTTVSVHNVTVGSQNMTREYDMDGVYSTIDISSGGGLTDMDEWNDHTVSYVSWIDISYI